MELNSYQLEVMADLKNYLDCIKAEDDLKISWKNYWKARGKMVGFGGVPAYQDKIPRVPHICIKVPTGGGKTFMACAALQPIYKKLLSSNKKVVVWLVPSEAILTQTTAALSDIKHSYRKRIEQDFQSNVEVYTKEMLLQAQNLSSSSINENLSICVLSYDSIRANKKEGRRVYRENGALAPLAEKLNIEDTALINILQELSPLVVVDESHNATSELSIEMLQNLNPSFILELTATPKNTSNVISYVNARALKAENMVKLPVIVYKKNTRQQVITDAIAMRNKLEMQAEENFKNGGKYIRPIVLFQAQPKSNDDNTTFDKVKEILVKMGIAEEQIKIKTANLDELKKDLIDKDCPVRYIITVNALKEGWDCPFAYILASLANKNSQTDVEQIVGRILRQPYATRQNKTLLNLAYVFSCYKNFNDTIDKIVAGMKFAGFTKNECRAAPEPPPQENSAQEELQLENETSTATETETETETDDFSDINTDEIKTDLQENISENDDAAQAEIQAAEFEENFKGKDNVQVSGKNKFAIREEFRESVDGLKIPQFFREVGKNFFDHEYIFLQKEHLSEKFTLDKQDANINFSISPDDLYQIDISEKGDALPQYKKIIGREREQFVSYLESLPSKNKINQCVAAITQIIQNNNTGISSHEIRPYVKKIIEGMDEGKLSVISRQYQFYASRIQQKILSLQENFRKKTFSRWIDTGEIICRNSFELPQIIDAPKNIDSIPKSLYKAEVSDMNNLERRMIDSLVTFENVKWWHRNISRKEFKVNGFINHYPDFMIMTNNGKILLIETKGDDRDNSDSQKKLELGRKWQARAGLNYKYFMVFTNKKINADGAYNFEEFLDVAREL